MSYNERRMFVKKLKKKEKRLNVTSDKVPETFHAPDMMPYNK